VTLWVTGVLAVLLWAATGWIIASPPGDNIDAQALGQMFVPGALALGLSLVWLVLAATRWL
jgi:hypothetical protein